MQKWETEGGRGGGGGGQAGVQQKKPKNSRKRRGGEVGGKMKGGNEPKKRVRPNFRTAGRRIRWRVPERTPKTPRPVASADYVCMPACMDGWVYMHILTFDSFMGVHG